MKYNYNLHAGIKKIKTKAFVAASAAGLVASSAALSLALLNPAQAQPTRVAGDWQLQPGTVIDFTCGGNEYLHTVNTVVQGTGGSFTGTGTYNADPAYTWNMTGSVSGDTLTFQIVYTGASAGSVYNGTAGVIAPDGSVSGVVGSNCETFDLAAGSVARFVGNHGQYVKSQTDKKAAAQSRVGMPVQSQGHTK